MLLGNQIRKGGVIVHNGEPHLVVSHFIQKFGRGGAHNKTKLKSLITGSSFPVTYNSTDRVEEADVSRRTMQFLYNDTEKAYFMDPETFDQVEILTDEINGGTDYLKADQKYIALFFEDNLISIEVPLKVSMKVTSAPPAVKGDSANNPQKEATTETGAKVMVPLFIKEGDIIEVNTEDNGYTGKNNN